MFADVRHHLGFLVQAHARGLALMRCGSLIGSIQHWATLLAVVWLEELEDKGNVLRL